LDIHFIYSFDIFLGKCTDMVLRDELNKYLAELYKFEDFEDACLNGLQVEGKEKIKNIQFGVSFNLPFLERAKKEHADAIIVHHGIFQQGAFFLKGVLKQRIKDLLDKDISLFGIHLPMDAHRVLGHNALLMSYIEAESVAPFELGWVGLNGRGYSLNHILRIFHQRLHPEEVVTKNDVEEYGSAFSISTRWGFSVIKNGPKIPKKIAIISGKSSGYFEKALDKGVDTFISGDVKESIPALSYETKTNYINLGHYYSEKPGVLALKEKISQAFDVNTGYIELPNPF
jgi:dinuclear metal center YbgI/SA1388 family protein